MKRLFNIWRVIHFNADQKGEFFLPFFISIIMLSFSVLPDGSNFFKMYSAFFPLLPFYFWGINRMLSGIFFYAFFIGLLQDLLFGNSIGIWIASYLSTSIPLLWFSSLSRKMEWFEQYFSFLMTLCVCMLTAFLVSIIVYEHTAYFFPLVKHMGVAALFYLVLERIFMFCKMKLKIGKHF